PTCGRTMCRAYRSSSSSERAMAAGRAEPARAALGLAQLLDLIELSLGHGRRNELGNALAAPDREGLVAVIDDDDLELPAIVAVDGPGRVGDRDPVLQREPRSRPDLDLEALGDRDLEARRDRVPLPGHQIEVLRRDDIHARRSGRGIARQGQALAMRQTREADSDGHSSSCAMRATRWRAMSSFAASGQSSMPSL